MKVVFWAILIMSSVAAANAQVLRYSMEQVGKDSFYIIETETRTIPGVFKPQEIKTPMFFCDSTALVEYIGRLKHEFDQMKSDLKAQAERAAKLAEKIRSIEAAATTKSN